MAYAGWGLRVKANGHNVPGERKGVDIWRLPFPPCFCRHAEIHKACHRVFLRRGPKVCLFNPQHLVLIDVLANASDAPDNMGEAVAPPIPVGLRRQLLLYNNV